MCSLIVNGVVLFCCFLTVESRTFDCHDDPTYEPEDGLINEVQFTWLGLLQYLHIQKNTPHYFRVPRVVLVSRQYVLSTAQDAAEVPPGYALGNVVFGAYERDEQECNLSEKEIEEGKQCDPAVLITPVADVILHPEYKHFKMTTTIALLRLLQGIVSFYMLPACLPFKNYLFDDDGKVINQLLKHMDFPADIPRDALEEQKEIETVVLLPRERCHHYGPKDYFTRKFRTERHNKTQDRTICTTGCGFHSGAPLIIHEHTGHWTLVAIAKGGPDCLDPMRNQFVVGSSHHIPIYRYLSWITAAITGEVVGPSVGDDPFGYAMSRGNVLRQSMQRLPEEKTLLRRGWVGRWWLGGIRCFDRGEAADDLYRFYFDIFEVRPSKHRVLTMDYHLQIDAPATTQIDCVKVGMPWFARVQPYVYDIGTRAVKVSLPVLRHKTTYRINIECWGHNVTEEEED